MQSTYNSIELNSQPLKTNWTNLTIVTVFHALAFVSLFYFNWGNLIALLILNWMVASLGVGIGYHRLLTHRSFKAPKWLEYTLTALGSLAIHDGAVKWVATHRIHHAHTETDNDPHSPREGGYWAHLGWIIRGNAQGHDKATIARFVPDLLKDSNHVLMARYYYIFTIALGIILFAIGGWSMVLWGVFLRTVVGWHSTWIVNSITHLWGRRRFSTQDDSTNNGLVAFFSFGEGWHNNHHAHPTSARHGLAWYEFDFNWMTIRLFKKIGLATQIREVVFNNQKAEKGI